MYSQNIVFLCLVPASDSLMCPPKFLQSLSDLTIKDGEALKLTCTVKGDPDPNITWSKNGEVILIYFIKCFIIDDLTTFNLQLLSSSDILDLKYRNGTATLSINEVYPEDEGVYTCKAKNTLGSIETTCRLTVQSIDI